MAERVRSCASTGFVFFASAASLFSRDFDASATPQGFVLGTVSVVGEAEAANVGRVRERRCGGRQFRMHEVAPSSMNEAMPPCVTRYRPDRFWHKLHIAIADKIVGVSLNDCDKAGLRIRLPPLTGGTSLSVARISEHSLADTDDEAGSRGGKRVNAS
ncbi:hypothetical protein [Bradyrhizobium stylosanthis]|uniref:hypothetical protein n=1 Tax=Bradyrhizobium stylosanthis TaxID=1803665 RepID=UPI001428D24F|nr:hypothetical protein [Bradyrhizobium stylosanthis]